MKKYDVIVAGGGFSGVAAAIAASREGSRVLLIEKSGALGGAANNMLVMPYMPYTTRMKSEDGSMQTVALVRGLFEEINKHLYDAGKLEDDWSDKIGIFDDEYLKIVLDRMVIESGVELLLHTTLTDVKTTGRKIESIEISTVAGKMEFEADYFIDATGDANLSALAGCEFNLGRPEDNLCQPMTLCFRVINVDRDALRQENPQLQALYRKYREEGKIKNPRENVLMFKPIADNTIHFNSTRVARLDPTNPFDLTRAQIEAREQMLELFTFLKQNFKAFSNADIISSAATIGVRESRMVVGEHCLTVEELLSTTKFDDAIAAGNYDIDIHNPEGTGTHHKFFPEGVYYTVPYRSLVARDKDNLLVAGRCISCEHEAQASIRIMPICCALGEAAGVAAAVLTNSRTAARDIDIKKVQSILKQNGAFF